jgi:hypothetical protein
MGDSEQIIELSVGSRDPLPLAWLSSSDLALPGAGGQRTAQVSVLLSGRGPVFPESLRAGARRKDRCGKIVP